MAYQDARLSKFEADFKQQQGEMTNKIDIVLKAITDRITGALPSDTIKNPKLNVNSTSSVSKPHDDKPGENKIAKTGATDKDHHVIVRVESEFPQSSDKEYVCTKGDDGDIMFIEIIKKYDDSREEELREDGNAATGGPKVEYFNTFLTRSELAYHKYLMCGPTSSLFLRNPIITKGCPSYLKIPCNIRHVHVEKSYIDLNSPLNIMTQMLYNWILRRKLDPRKDTNKGVSNFTRRIKGMHIFVGNFTYVVDFMIVEDISSIIDPRLSQVVLGKPFVEISNMTHGLLLRVVKFTDVNEIAYKVSHKIEQYNSLSDLETEHMKSVYLRNEEDKRRGGE
ncbi:hypothetical protein Tco_0542226 [Tanacetum coccineum]